MKLVSKMLFLVGILLSQISIASVFVNTATVILKQGQEQRYMAAARQFDIINLTRKEPGNYVYRLHIDKSNPRLIVFTEVWRTKADLDFHLQTPHMNAFFKSINFDPSLYVITAKGNAVTFTPKPSFYNYVIEVLKLEGIQK